MDQYEIIYKGEIMPTLAADQVRSNLATLFKTPAEKLDTLFNGRPHTLKSGLNRDQADQYRNALKNAGAIVYLRRSGARLPGADAAGATGLSLARQHGYLLREDERRTVAPVSIDTRHIELASPSEPQVSHAAAPAAPPPATDHLSLAQLGCDLGPPRHSHDERPDIDIQRLAICPPGPLLQTHEHATPTPPPALTLDLQLVPDSLPAAES